MSDYAGKKKVFNDIEKKVKHAASVGARRANEKRNQDNKIQYYAKLLRKNEMAKQQLAKKVTVGQHLWAIDGSGDYRARSTEPEKVTVSEVARKYFKVKEHPHRKYDLSTLRQVAETSYLNQCYLSKQEILDMWESEKLFRGIKDAFSGYGKPPFTLEQLRSVAKILNVTVK